MPGVKLAINFMSGQKQSTTSKKLISEEEKHLQTFAEHQHINQFFQRTGEMVNFHLHIQHELLSAYRGLFDPTYDYLKTCPACVAEFLTLAYRRYAEKINV